MLGDLSSRQCVFASRLCLLIWEAQRQGYAVKIAYYLRSLAEEQAMINAGKTQLTDPSHSKHVQGLAVDLALFKGGALTEDPADYKALGAYWTAMGGTWGGSWHPLDARGIGFDPDHFEISA